MRADARWPLAGDMKAPTGCELWPLILRLPREERLRLAMLALRSAVEADGAAYAHAPIGHDEFSSTDEPLSWDGEGWQGFYAHVRT